MMNSKNIALGILVGVVVRRQTLAVHLSYLSIPIVSPIVINIDR